MRSDRKLVKACLKGHRQSQRKLYEKYKLSLFTLCLRYADGRSEAEDFLQESFLKIFRDLHQFDPEKGALYTWMRTVTINTALQILRKNKLLLVELDEVMLEHKLQPEADIISELELSDLMELIQKLPVGYRTVFNLYEIEGYSHKEIAEILDISVGTSRSQFFKARKLLRESIAELSLETRGTHVGR